MKIVRRTREDTSRSCGWLRWQRLLVVALAAVACQAVLGGELLPGFAKGPQFEEQVRWSVLESGVRVHLNAPLDMKSERRVLVLFATPNGSTIEQTLGCKAAEGLD